MKPDPMDRLDDLDALDQGLREAYEPRAGVAERLARGALTPADSTPRRTSWLRPALVTLAVLTLVAVSWWVFPRVVSETVPDSPRHVAERPAAASTIPEPTPPVRLSISNLDGPVTVTHAEGTRWIALPTPPKRPGDFSS